MLGVMLEDACAHPDIWYTKGNIVCIPGTKNSQGICRGRQASSLPSCLPGPGSDDGEARKPATLSK